MLLSALQRNFTALLLSFVALVLTYATIHSSANDPSQTASTQFKKSAPLRHATESQDTDGLTDILGPRTIPQEDGFTIITPPYKRTDTLQSFIDHYANATIPSLRKIILSWGDATLEPPASLTQSLSTYPIPIIIERPTHDSLNERFRRIPSLTTDAILSLDDDMIFFPTDMEFAYRTWRDFGGRKRMLGFQPRFASDDNPAYGATPLRQYSMVLTKSAFYHVDWMDLYWSDEPTITALRAYVDDKHNCEDILMSFLHTKYAQVAPLYVKAPYEDRGTRKGISTTKGHYELRSECVRHFLSVLGSGSLVSSTMMIKNMAPTTAEDTGREPG